MVASNFNIEASLNQKRVPKFNYEAVRGVSTASLRAEDGEQKAYFLPITRALPCCTADQIRCWSHCVSRGSSVIA